MDLFRKRLDRREGPDIAGRLAALEDYVEYLRQQGEYGFGQVGREGKERGTNEQTRG